MTFVARDLVINCAPVLFTFQDIYMAVRTYMARLMRMKAKGVK